jgi:heme exporter protein A
LFEADRLACVRGGRHLFSELSFTLPSATLLHVTGANGAGKTSLLRILCGLLAPMGGSVRWRGEPIQTQRELYCRDLRYVGHQPGIKDEFTAEENLQFSAALAGIPATRADLRAALERFGMGAFVRTPVRMLSQGQRRRVALARLALADPAALWVLDEPLVALDAAAGAQVLELIGRRLEEGASVVMTSHQSFTVSADVQSLIIAG